MDGKRNNSLSLWERVRVREALKGRKINYPYNRLSSYILLFTDIMEKLIRT